MEWELAKHEFHPLPPACEGEALTSIKCLLGEPGSARRRNGLGWAGLRVSRREGEALASRCVQQLGQLPSSLFWAQGHPGLPLRAGGPRRKKYSFCS